MQLIPKPNTRLEKRFKTIDVWVDLSNNMPKVIKTLDTNQTTFRTTEFSNVQIDPKLSDSDFALSRIESNDWQLHEEALNE